MLIMSNDDGTRVYYSFWFVNSNQVMDEMISAKVKRVVAASLLALVMLISPIIIYLVRDVTITIQVSWSFRCYY